MKKGFLRACGLWFLHVRHCSLCEFHEPGCEPGRVLSERVVELGGEGQS